MSTRGMLGNPSGEKAGKIRSDGSASGRDVIPGNPRAHSFGQWTGVRREGTAGLAGEARHRNTVHRTRKSLGERLMRKFQREATGRVPERRDFLFVEGGAGRNREMAGDI